MALDFPTSPTNGQVYEQYVYDSALPGWRSKGGAVAAIYTSDTAPSGAVKGDMWYRTSDGTTYVYVVDANTSQWVEIRSEIATSKVGLVPVIPASVAVGSGSASVSATGIVTFTGASSVSINGCFTATYKNYRVIYVNEGASAGAQAFFRYRASGTDNSGAAYYYGGNYGTWTGATGARNGQNATSMYLTWIGNSTAAYGRTSIDISNPFAARATWHSLQNGYYDGSTLAGEHHSGMFSVEAIFDGFSFFPSSGGMSGTIQIYGYN